MGAEGGREGGGEGGRERGREGGRERERQTDRQTDRDRDRQGQCQRQRQKRRETGTQRQTDRQTVNFSTPKKASQTRATIPPSHLNVVQLPDEEVTEGHLREAIAQRDVHPLHQLVHHLEAEDVVVHGQEGVQQEELQHHVDAVQELDEQVEAHQEGPVPLGQPEADHTCTGNNV